MKLYTAKNIRFGAVIGSGLFIDAIAGENLCALSVCYIKASDGLTYLLNTGIPEVNNCISIMALEDVPLNKNGRFCSNFSKTGM